MVNFNKYRCRNCGHWHNSIWVGKCGNRPPNDPLLQVQGSSCECHNWESLDNLVYLEQKYKEKSLNGNK